MRRRPESDVGDTWTRRRLVMHLAAGATVAGLLVYGLALSIHGVLEPQGRSTDAHAPAHAAPTDAGASPFPPVGDDAALPGRLSTERAQTMVIPPPTRLGAAGVPSGFPRSTRGAVAQLAAIDQTTLEAASVPRAQEIVGAWAAPGGPTAQSWSGVRAVADLLSAADQPATGSPSLSVTALPAMALVQQHPQEQSGTSSTAVVCVDLVVTATIERTSRVAVADCQRLQWANRRWQLAAGDEPPQAPSVWPGTEVAHEVGYLTMATEPGAD